MKYKVLIKKCEDSRCAAAIADEIAGWSGSPTELVLAAIEGKDVCIRKEADDIEASELKARFEAVGASVELVALGDACAAGPPNPGYDDGEDGPGRVLSDEEYTEQLKKRTDIFIMDKDTRLRNLELVALVLAFIAGLYLSTREMVEVANDFFEKNSIEREVTLVEPLPETLKMDEEKEREDALRNEAKKLRPNKHTGKGGKTGGGGDPRARVTRQGVLGIINGCIKGRTIASADIFGKGGFASGIDAILSGVGGLMSGGSGGVGRKGAAGIGYGAGYGSGFGGGSGGIDDLIGNLLNGTGDGLAIKKRGTLRIAAPKFENGRSLIGGRSRSSIMRVVMQNLAALRYAYNKRLREKPGLKGRITVKFAIDEFGEVIFCSVVSSTMSDPSLEKTVASKIRRWAFEKIDKPGDVTEVIYPFVFSQ